MAKKNFTIGMTEDLIEQVRMEAEIQGVSIAKYVAAVLEKDMEIQRLSRIIKQNKHYEKVNKFVIVHYDCDMTGGTTVYETEDSALQDAVVGWSSMEEADKQDVLIYAVAEIEAPAHVITKIINHEVTADNYIVRTVRDFTL